MKSAALSLLLLAVAASALAADVVSRHAEASSGTPAEDEALSALLAEIGVRTLRVEATLLSLDAQPVDGLVVRTTGAPPSDAEIAAALRVTESGGTLLVVAEPALARRLGLEVVPAAIRPAIGDELRGDAEHAPRIDGAMPLLGPGEPALLSQPESFVDADGDGLPSEADIAGPFPVARRALDDRALVLSTPSLFDDATLEDDATRAFARETLAALFPPGSTVALDATRSADAPMRDALLAVAVDASERAPLSMIVPATLVAAALAAAAPAFRPAPRERVRERDSVPLPEERP